MRNIKVDLVIRKVNIAKNAKDENKFAFATQHKAHSMSVCKWIMNSRITKHMTLRRATIDT